MIIPNIFADTIFDEIFEEVRKPFFEMKSSAPWMFDYMKTDILETEDAYQLEIELPGVNKEEVQIALKDGDLIVTADPAEQAEEKKYIRKERKTEKKSRHFNVGEFVTPQDISAAFQDGLLKITIKKAVQEEEKEKTIIDIE